MRDALAHKRAVTAFGEVAIEGAVVAAEAELVNEAGHETAQERIVRGGAARTTRRGLTFRNFRSSILAGQQALLLRDLHDLIEGLLHLPR